MAAEGGIEESVTRFLDAWLRTRQLIQAANFNRFQSAGLSATQFMTLNLIPANDDGMTLSELARRMNLGVATLTKTVDSLEARGLVVRTKSAMDRRQVMLTLTGEGKSLQNSASAEFHGQMTTLFEKMSATGRRGLVMGLEGLLRASGPQTEVAMDARAAGGKRSAPRSRRRRS